MADYKWCVDPVFGPVEVRLAGGAAEEEWRGRSVKAKRTVGCRRTEAEVPVKEKSLLERATVSSSEGVRLYQVLTG